MHCRLIGMGKAKSIKKGIKPLGKITIVRKP